jgi:uncharacterized coiled-coil protein SlyX
MGFLWDLMQQSQLSAQEQRSASLEGRVAGLETELRRTQEILHALIERLETKIGADLNEDGKVG